MRSAVIRLDRQARLYGSFIRRLVAIGATQCPQCRDYVFLERHACSGALAPSRMPADALAKAA